MLAVATGPIVNASSLAQAQQQIDSTGGQTDQEQGPVVPDIPTPFPVQIVEDDTAADARQRSEEETRQREIADLAAQEGMNAATQAMNRATQRMAEYAFWSTVFVAIGTVLLIITLVLTWMAKRAAQAAIDVTRSVGQAQTRAYLSVRCAHFFRAIGLGQFEGFNSTDVFHVTLEVSNTGATPAIWYEISGACEALGGDGFIDTCDIPFRRWPGIHGGVSLSVPFRALMCRACLLSRGGTHSEP